MNKEQGSDQMITLCCIPEILISHLSILILAFVLDLAGEPPQSIHPTVLMGKLAERLTKKMLNLRSHQRLLGFLLTTTVVILATGSALLLLEVTKSVLGQLAYIILGSLILKTSFAIRSMDAHTRPIKDVLISKDLPRARELLSRIVRRETTNLDEGQCASATIESIAEGTVDGIVSPLFYFFLFGVAGAIAFRAINTLDSTVGYKDRTYAQIGWFSARSDTVANYIPARLTAIIMIFAAAIIGRDWHSAISTLRKEHGRTESLNAGWPMSAMAGSLGTTLEKVGSYSLGEGLRVPSPKDISSALQMMYTVTMIFPAIAVLTYSIFFCSLAS
jgi:adenosylcobinamide-phosphate synthase